MILNTLFALSLFLVTYLRPESFSSIVMPWELRRCDRILVVMTLRQKTHRLQYQYRLPVLFTRGSLLIGFRLSFYVFVARSLRLFAGCLEEDVEEGVEEGKEDNASSSSSSIRS